MKPTTKIFSAIFLSFSAFQLCAQSANRPNILFFLVDDMGTQDTSVPFIYDQQNQPVISELNKLYRTPNMEKLAKNGRLFTQAHAYTVCSPTRISLITGLNAPHHKVTQWTHPKTYKSEPGSITTKTIRNPKWAVKGLPGGIPTLPALLKQAGYATLFAGKAHFGPDDTPNGDPKNIGFDVNIAGFGGGGPGSYWGKYNYSANHRTGAHVWDVPGLKKYHGTDTFLTEAITLEMNQAIEQSVKAKKPFFAYMSHYAVHANNLFSTFIKDDWKVIYGYASSSWELYNLKNDPYETLNLVSKSPEIFGSMAKAMVNALDRNQASYPVSVTTGEPIKPRF
ncbi:MAG: sulfatase-like hydrolase/transferase [Kiritimatiellae bacterium]|jgi:arylsulfatase A-like enzyme|nr:sulfatase-like hydrolase/transferase [Kiritimatiellia bacterium]